MSPKRRKPKPRNHAEDVRRGMRGELTNQQTIFVEEYFVNGNNGRQAAIAAGYSRDRADREASELLRHPVVRKHLQRGRADLEQRYEATPERVVREIAMMAFAVPTEVVSIDGGALTFHNSADLTPGARRLITGATETTSEHGGSLKVTLESRLKALDLLANILGLKKSDNPFSAFKPDPTKPLQAVAIYMPAQLEA